MKNSFPEGKKAWSVKIGEKGQFVIPKEARDMFDFNPGDTILVLADIKRGIAIPPKSAFSRMFQNVFNDKNNNEECDEDNTDENTEETNE